MTCEQSRRIDQMAIDDFAMSGLVLMENAGRSAAEAIDSITQDECSVIILCGHGNNGGDGYVIARHLQLRGHRVSLVSAKTVDELRGEASHHARIAQRAEIPIDVVKDGESIKAERFDASVLVDCLLGTGATGPPRGIYGDLVRAANQAVATRIAIDIPTGLDADHGQALDPTFQADHTITFVAPKIGFAENEAAKFLGQVHVASIGVPWRLLETMRRRLRPSH